MLEITHVVEPLRLWLTWQPTTGGSRYLVGQIDRCNDGTFQLEYHLASDSFRQAQAKGFEGHPAFDVKVRQHSNNILAPFLRRLPPKSRGDFKHYLAQHLLPHPFTGSDFTLLAYTGAKSPGDGFSLVPDFSGCNQDIEYQLEVAGTRYETALNLNDVQQGDSVVLTPEPDNPHDSCAIAIRHHQGRLGYVNKVLCGYLDEKCRAGKVSAIISRKNGTSERPLVYVLLKISQ